LDEENRNIQYADKGYKKNILLFKVVLFVISAQGCVEYIAAAAPSPQQYGLGGQLIYVGFHSILAEIRIMPRVG
jgi:hypothetical protein